MVDLSAYSESNFIKPSEVKEMVAKGQPYIVMITTEAVLVKTDFKGQTGERVECEVVTQDNKERAISLNKTSVGNLIKKWGADSKNWVGHKLNLTTQYYASYNKDGITANPMDGDAITIAKGVRE